VIKEKNITNSNGLLTGVLNLTIDKAPIIPSDKAMLLDINVVIMDVIGGNKQKVNVWWYVVTHFCFTIAREDLKAKPNNIERRFNKKKSKYE